MLSTNIKAAHKEAAFLFLTSSKLLRQRAQHDLVDALIGRLFEGDGATESAGMAVL